MLIDIPVYKYLEVEQTINLNNNISTLIGENGSGKSSILESIFSNYIDKENEIRDNGEIYNLEHQLRCIAFTSGQNELFSSIFNNYDKNAKKYNREGEQTMRSFYFDTSWSRLLIFFATSLKKDGLVRKYLKENNYINIENNKDIDTYINLNFRVRKPLSDKIINEHEIEESGEYIDNSLIRSLYIKYLGKLIVNKIDENYDFRDKSSINRIISKHITLTAREIEEIFGNNIEEIFTFIARASTTWLSNFSIDEIVLYFKDDLEFKQLSDGEYQLLLTYAMLDLFDNENTIFLFDEVDSHLH